MDTYHPLDKFRAPKLRHVTSRPVVEALALPAGQQEAMRRLGVVMGRTSVGCLAWWAHLVGCERVEG